MKEKSSETKVGMPASLHYIENKERFEIQEGIRKREGTRVSAEPAEKGRKGSPQSDSERSAELCDKIT